MSADPLFRCKACCFKSRDRAAILAHAEQAPSTYFGPHVVYAPPTLTHPAMSLVELRAQQAEVTA